MISEATLAGVRAALPRVDAPRTRRLFNLNCSALKDIPIRDRARLQFRAEFFNATNSVTFGKPGANISASNFGVVSTESTGTGPRVSSLG